MILAKVTPQEALDCEELAHEWAESYDTKDWDRLSRIVASEVKINYAGVNDIDKLMPASEFLQMMSSPGFLGDPLIRTQHFVGATKWRKVDVDRIEGHHQIRSTHHRFDAPPVGDNSEGKKSSVAAKSHVLAIITYVCVNGEWKWGGIKTDIRWHDGKFIDIFRDF